MHDLIVFACAAVGVGFLILTGIVVGNKFIDKMLCVPPPRDPSKPIVLKHHLDS